MALNIQRWLSITATEGGADAFGQGSVATDIVPEDGLILKVTGIHVEVTNHLASIGADAVIEFSVTRDTKAAIPLLSDSDVFLKEIWDYNLVTSGLAVFTQVFRYDGLTGVYLVEPTIYAQIDSSATGLTLVANFRLFYEEVRATEVEILRITTNS